MNGNKDDLDNQFGPDDDLLEEGMYDEALDEELDAADADYGDEDWDAYDGDDESGVAPAADDEEAKKKKRARFNAMVIGGGAVLGILFLGFNMLKGGSAPAPAPVAQQQAAQQQDVAAQIAAEEKSRSRLSSASLQANSPTAQRNVIYGRGREDAPQEQASEENAGGLLNDPSEIARVEQYRAALEQELINEEQQAMELEAAEEAALQAEARRAQEPVAAVTAEAVPPMPVAANNAESSILTPLPETLPQEEAVPSVGLPKAQDLVLAQDEEQAAAELADTQEAPSNPFGDDGAGGEPAAVPTDYVPAEELAAVTQELETLKAEMQRMKKEVAQVQDLQSTVKQLERALEARATAPAQPAANRAASRDDSPPARVQAAPVRWVLKSARPGQAMISRAGESEMRNVTIGDNLPGVGRVTQIYRGNNGWIVEGTTGRITQ